MNTYLVAYFAYQAAAVFAGQCRVLDGVAQCNMEAAMKQGDALFPATANSAIRLQHYWPAVERLRLARERTAQATQQMSEAIDAANTAYAATLTGRRA